MAATAYIALGANTGDRRANLRTALARLGDMDGIGVIKVSSLLENPAVGGPPDSPAFLNAAAELQTTLAPLDLLTRMLAIEQSLGRVRREKWGPRPIDLDLLLYGQEVLDEPGLTVPHPLMHERQFVLEPLAEIAPNVVHPILKQTARQMLARLTNQVA